MSVRRTAIGLACAPLFISVLNGKLVMADDAIAAASNVYEVVLENDSVRVLRGVYEPGEVAAMHEHPATVSIQITGGLMRATLPDGETTEVEIERGSIGYSEESMHEFENIGDEPLEVILVELKEM